MSYRRGTYILISKTGVVYGLYYSPASAKCVRTTVLKGIGDIYFVNTSGELSTAHPSLGGSPRLELVDSKR